MFDLLNRSMSKLFFVLFFFVILVSSLAAKDIPITTKSEKAKQLFIEGRNMNDNLQSVEASRMFDKAIQLDEDFALAHAYRAVTGVGGFNVTQDHLNKAIKLASNVTDGERNLISLFEGFINGDQMKQKKSLDNLLTDFPGDKRVQVWEGIYHYGLNDFATAKKFFTAAVKIDSKFAPAYNMLGYVDFKLNDFTGAESAFKTYISLIPDNPNPYDSYAELLLNMGKYDESINQYQMALKKDPKFTSSLVGIGNCNIFKGNYNEARQTYQKSFDESDDITGKLGALNLIATSYVYQGNTKSALSTIEKARDLAQKNHLTTNVINSYNTEGFILTEAGKPEEALKKIEMASNLINRAMLPENANERLTLTTNLNRCRALISANKTDEAQKDLNMIEKTVMKRNNQNEKEAFNSAMALLEIKKGNYQQAVNHLDKSDLTSDVNQYYMGVAYQKLGNKNKADECFQKVKNSRTNNLGLATVRSRATE